MILKLFMLCLFDILKNVMIFLFIELLMEISLLKYKFIKLKVGLLFNIY